jgi:inorganic pyrophosphatase
VSAQTPQPFPNHPLAQLGVRDEEGRLNVVIESPQGSRNKFKFDEKRGFFMLDGVLPAGASFPYDFGFVPGTLGEDGDALDVLLLMDEPAFCGCVVPSRLIGVIVAEQTERDGETMRNDRLLAVADKSHANRDVTSIEALNETIITEIEHFFASYNMVRGKEFKALQHSGPDVAEKLLQEGERRFKEQHS